MNNTVLDIQKLEKKYVSAAETITVLQGLDIALNEGGRFVITGESGSGKSTLLNIIGGLDTATAGKITAGPYEVTALDENRLTEYRSKYVGLIFQFHYLLKDFTALENVFLPAYMIGSTRKAAMEAAKQLLCDVGLEKRMHHLPSQLSGGERQRVSVARALINNPRLILADEPTGNLDPANALTVSSLLFSLSEQYKKTLVLVTHDQELARRGDICCRLENGKLVVV